MTDEIRWDEKAGLLYLLRFERVDNLGACRIPLETGLLIPSDFAIYATFILGRGKSRMKPVSAQRATLRNSTLVLLVGNIEATMQWYERIGFEASYFPPGFCVLRRDAVKIFLQQKDGYVKPDDPAARERGAWNVYIETDNVDSLFEELAPRDDVKVIRGLCRQEYGQIEFDVMDPNGYVLVFAQPVAKDV